MALYGLVVNIAPFISRGHGFESLNLVPPERMKGAILTTRPYSAISAYGAIWPSGQYSAIHFHPFAMQAAVWITNRLPRPSRGGKSPFQMLSHKLPDIVYLYAFGCLCATVLPTPRRVGDRHFADRGEYGLYLGPSEESPAHGVYLLSSRRIVTAAKIRVWEDQFPGIKGSRYVWFDDMHAESVPDVADNAVPTEAAADVPLTSDASVVVDQPSADDGPDPPLDSIADDVPAPLAPVDGQPTPSVSSTGDNNVPAEPRRSRRVAGVELPQTIFAQRAYSRPSLSQSIVAFLMLASSASALTSCPISPGFAYDQCTAPVCDNPIDVVTAAVYAHAVTITSDFGDVRVPKTYAQALSSTHAAYWREAINKELAGLMKLNTWVCIPEQDMPLGSNLMHCHFVFAVKRKADGSIEKFKARLVADGNTQKFGVDFDRIFSSVVKNTKFSKLRR